MSKNTQIYFSADPKDLSCPVCYSAFGQGKNQPISTNCGHTICSTCFGKVTKCPFCKVAFDKTKKHQKSVLLSSLIANSMKTQVCKEHSNICQGICRQDKVFVCLDCVVKNHQGHKILTMKDLNEKTKKIAKGAQKARKKEKMQIELKESLEDNNLEQKERLDEIIDQEIFQLSMLKKKLYKEIDIQTFSYQDHVEHKLLSENLFKDCNNADKMLEDWNNNQEVDLAIQIMDNLPEIPDTQKFEKEINLFKSSIAKKQEQFMNFTKKIGQIRESSAKVNKLFVSNKNDPDLNFPKIELDYLADVLRQCCFIVSCKDDDVLEIKDDEKRVPLDEFDFSYFTCSLSKISLNFLEPEIHYQFDTICGILERVRGLKDLILQNFYVLNLAGLLELLSNLKSLEKCHIEVDLNEPYGLFGSLFVNRLISLKNLSNLDIQYREPQTIISFQLTQSQNPLTKPLETLQEVSLNVGGCPAVVCEALNRLNSCQSLKILRLSFGKANNTQVLGAVRKTLQARSDLEELTLTCEELNSSTQTDFSLLLKGLTQKKKLGIIVNSVSLSESCLPTDFLVGFRQDLEEFTFKIKCGTEKNPYENFVRLIEFLANSKGLKKLCLQFDGIHSTFCPTENLFNQIATLQTLISLEIEFLNFNAFNLYAERDLEAILNKLPAHVTKKCTFSRPNSQ